MTWTDIVGIDGVNSRISAGPLLSMMDLCAYRIAEKVSGFATKRTGTTYNSCTVAVNNTNFACPILHGDSVRMDGRVIHAGGSSLGIYIRFYRNSPSTRLETTAGEAFFTMVLITPELKSAKVAPEMVLTDPEDIKLHHRYNQIREAQKKNDVEGKAHRATQLTAEEVDGKVNRSKSMHMTIGATQCVANRIFFSSYLNNNNTVFGGEIMSWMERHAVHCGRMLTENKYVYAVGMHSVSFPEPIYSSDWVTLIANATYVRNTTMEVEVTLTAERKTTGQVITNRASFVLINMNEIGQKAKIRFGIDLSKATQEELQRYMEARTRYKRRRAYRYAFSMLAHENDADDE
ncbi:ATP-binding protein Cassette (ABC) superfamily [Strigomonas culicis]|uniref:ATP-binding protein Cassette (ABC) superfamily n=1 Tax=Strigomonas culicis TaxID=28005 RepID=S9UZQ4_9TRYP|nr:ATP-binding protein Cassette (ABC) superfamily [Strigomonas culicis]|eukprot:EPY36347.1 ATP-binding protein Cassette (ABC) superfamily [Strigomonas culicis]